MGLIAQPDARLAELAALDSMPSSVLWRTPGGRSAHRA